LCAFSGRAPNECHHRREFGLFRGHVVGGARRRHALKGTQPREHIHYENDVYVWSSALNHLCTGGNVIRRHYYTSKGTILGSMRCPKH
jgi:hypothetical protein